MATTVEQPNGDATAATNIKIVERLDAVPIVHDSVAYAQQLINSTPLTAGIYQTAVNVANRSLEAASPVLNRTKPLLESADNLAVATIDRAEQVFPYPFKTKTEDLVGVKQAKAVYDARVAPLIQQASPIIQEYITKTAAINHELGARAQATITKSTEISHELLEQLRTLADQSKELPHQLLEGLTKVHNDVKGIVLSKEGTVQDKTNKLGAYVVEQVKPIVDEIYAYVLRAKKGAVEEGEKVEAEAPAVEVAAEKASE